MTGRLGVPPTRTVLLRLKRRRQMLTGAVDLLERKQRVLAQKIYEMLPVWEEEHRTGYARLLAAYDSFVLTDLRSTAAERRYVVGGMEALVSVRTERSVIAGVAAIDAAAEVVALRPRFGFLGSTSELDRTMVSLRDATAGLVRLAGLQATLQQLARALGKTNRQVGMLRNRVIPLHDAAIRNVEEVLDEQERSYLFQLKRLS